MIRYKANLIANDVEKKIKIVLKDWEQLPRDQDDYSIRLAWKQKQCQLVVFLFWGDNQEGIRVNMFTPRDQLEREWRELSGRTVDDIVDSLATFATISLNSKRPL